MEPSSSSSSSSLLPSDSSRTSSLPPSSPRSETPSEPVNQGLIRPRADRDSEDEDEDGQPAVKRRKKRSFEEEVSYRGRRLGRVFHFSIDYSSLLDEGRSLSRREDSTLSDSEKRRLKRYTTLLLEYPGIIADDERCDERGIGSLPTLLRTGCGAARSEDISTLKKAMPTWNFITIPMQKKMRGYADSTCLKLLAPPNFPLDNPDVVEGIRSLRGPYALTPKHLPSFLYLDGINVPGNVYKGLFLSEILLRGGLCVLRGHDSSTEGKAMKNTGKSIAERHKIKIITPAFIAYIATLIRFTLSDQTQWGTSETNGWKYDSFYRQLLNLLEVKMTSATVDKIKSAWKSRIFGDCMDSDEEDEDDDVSTSQEPSLVPDLRQMIIEQANRDKEEEAENQRQAEAEARRQVEIASRALRDATNGVRTGR